MENFIRDIQYRNRNIRISHDHEFTQLDLEENMNGFLLYGHPKITIDRLDFNPNHIREACESLGVVLHRGILDICERRGIMMYEGYYVFPVYAFRSNAMLYLKRPPEYYDGAYSSCYGIIMVEKTYGQWSKKECHAIAVKLVEWWNHYLLGEVYRYDTETDFRGGYIGSLSQCIEDAKHSVDEDIKYDLQQALIRKKVEIKHRVPLNRRTTIKIY